MSLLSTVFTTISSGVYCETSNRSFKTLLSPSSWINGELISDAFDCTLERLLLLEVVELKKLKNHFTNHETFQVMRLKSVSQLYAV